MQSEKNMIRKLDRALIARIAAGQVVENPASILKELLENSLDAGAQHITVRLQEGGKKSITVQDDGVGIAAAEMELALERYTTSKLDEEVDLTSVATYGFRGEALFSIAEVAHVDIISRVQHAQHGWMVKKTNGSVKESKAQAYEEGTKITVSDLFSNHPARKVFLDSVSKEQARCMDVFTQVALAHSEVAFKVFVDESLLYTVAAETPPQRMLSLGIISHPEQVIHCKCSAEFFDVSAYIGVPQIASETDHAHYSFVNERPVRIPTLSRSLKRAYGTLLEARRFPLAVIYLTVNKNFVDVNVHPQKQTVAIRSMPLLIHEIEKTVKDTLTAATIHYRKEHSLYFRDTKQMDRALGSELKITNEPWHPAQMVHGTDIQQLHRLYLLAQTADGLLLIDQHAAHERILYEQYTGAFTKLNKRCVLDEPCRVQLTPSEVAQSDLLVQHLRRMGCESTLENKQLEVTSLPHPVERRRQQSFVTDLVHSILHDSPTSETEIMHTTCAYLACKHAIKAGDPLTMHERKKLVEKLFSTTSNYTCPHGRPVYITVSLSELEQWFHRRV